jgi:hypothetical protein
VSVPEETLAGVDQALDDFGKNDAEVTEVRQRHTHTTAMDLQAVDAELLAIAQAESFDDESTDLHNEGPPAVPAMTEPAPNEDVWSGESTEVEIVDDSDFVLLVDENDLEELEKVGEDDALTTTPAGAPDDEQQVEAEGSFFKKLFGGRRTSSSPQ